MIKITTFVKSSFERETIQESVSVVMILLKNIYLCKSRLIKDIKRTNTVVKKSVKSPKLMMIWQDHFESFLCEKWIWHFSLTMLLLLISMRIHMGSFSFVLTSLFYFLTPTNRLFWKDLKSNCCIALVLLVPGVKKFHYYETKIQSLFS